MASSLLVLVALLAGYLFSHLFHVTSFRSQTLAGHRLILESAGIGILALGVARTLVVIWTMIGWPPFLFEHWPRLVHSTPLVGTCLMTLPVVFVAGTVGNLCVGWRHRHASGEPKRPSSSETWFHRLVGWRPSHRWWNRLLLRARDYWEVSRKIALELNIRLHGSSLHKLLHHVATHPRSEHAIGLTMDNGKVYAAFVTKPPTLSSADSYVSVVPLISGYREKDTLRVFYDTIYEVAKLDELRAGSEVVVTLPLAEIKSAHLLDKDYLAQKIASIDEAAP